MSPSPPDRALRVTPMSTGDIVEAAVWIAALPPWRLAGATPASMQQEMLKRRCVALRDGSEIIAVAAHAPERREGAFLSVLAVRPDRQGQGVGSHLLDIVEREIFQTQVEVHVCISEADEVGGAWLRARGYRLKATLPGYGLTGAVVALYVRRRTT